MHPSFLGTRHLHKPWQSSCTKTPRLCTEKMLLPHPLDHAPGNPDCAFSRVERVGNVHPLLSRDKLRSTNCVALGTRGIGGSPRTTHLACTCMYTDTCLIVCSSLIMLSMCAHTSQGSQKVSKCSDDTRKPRLFHPRPELTPGNPDCVNWGVLGWLWP